MNFIQQKYNLFGYEFTMHCFLFLHEDCTNAVFLNATCFGHGEENDIHKLFRKKPINILQTRVLDMKQINSLADFLVGQVPPLNFLQAVDNFL